MARKRRLNTRAEELESNKDKIYLAGVYRRLSVEDDGEDPEKNSIGNQLKIAEDYVSKAPFIRIKKVYEDNGYTGMNFNRPGFKQMMEDLQNGVIDTVIVKDISRLGRHYIYTSELVEKTFPLADIRLICINDDFDSKDPRANAAALLFQIKILMNDSYAKDYSKKIRSSINAKMENGEFLASSGSIPYGYIRNPKNNTFDVDEEVRDVIEMMFLMREQGYTYTAIAKKLNEDGIPSPARLRFNRGLSDSEKYRDAIWLHAQVKRITMDQVYIGNRVHGKVKKDRLDQKKTRRGAEEWLVVEAAHEAIISKEMFERVQKINAGTSKNYRERKTGPVIADDKRALINGKIFCGDCGSAMSGKKAFTRETKQHPRQAFAYFTCNKYTDSQRTICSAHYIKQTEVVAAIQSGIDSQIRLLGKYEGVEAEILNRPMVQVKLNRSDVTVKSARVKLNNLEAKKERLFQDMLEGILEQDEYDFMVERIALEVSQLQADLDKAKQIESDIARIRKTKENMLRDLKQGLEPKDWTKEYLDSLVKRIIIYEGKRIFIEFNFADPFKELQQWAEMVETEA